MPKHAIGDKVKHSRHGDGKVTAIGTKTITPPPFDKVKLDGERWNLRARLHEIDRILERGAEPRAEDEYTITYSSGRQDKYEELALDKLKGRAANPES